MASTPITLIQERRQCGLRRLPPLNGCHPVFTAAQNALFQELDRAKVRAEFESRFTAERMARDHVDIYRQLIAGQSRLAWGQRLNAMYDGKQAIRLARTGWS